MTSHLYFLFDIGERESVNPFSDISGESYRVRFVIGVSVIQVIGFYCLIECRYSSSEHILPVTDQIAVKYFLPQPPHDESDVAQYQGVPVFLAAGLSPGDQAPVFLKRQFWIAPDNVMVFFPHRQIIQKNAL
jgi:hypothetical protein